MSKPANTPTPQVRVLRKTIVKKDGTKIPTSFRVEIIEAS